MDTSIGGTHPVVLGSPRPILRGSNAPSPMWDEIQDMPGEIFCLSLRDRCLAVAEAQAWEINGDIDRLDPDELDSLLSRLTPDNLMETAGKVAQAAAWAT